MTPKPHVNGKHRRVMCQHYDRCLDHAISRRWRGFSCDGCRDLEQVRMDPEAWMEDGFRCEALIWFVMKNRRKKPRIWNVVQGLKADWDSQSTTSNVMID